MREMRRLTLILTFSIGFTAVTKRLLKLGTEGLEFLKNNLSDYFDDLVSMIHEMVYLFFYSSVYIFNSSLGWGCDFLFW